MKEREEAYQRATHAEPRVCVCSWMFLICGRGELSGE